MHVNVLAKKHNAWSNALIYKGMTLFLKQRKKKKYFPAPSELYSRILCTNIDDKFWWITLKSLACNHLQIGTRALACADGHKQLVLMSKTAINYNSSTVTKANDNGAQAHIASFEWARLDILLSSKYLERTLTVLSQFLIPTCKPSPAEQNSCKEPVPT